MTKINKEIIKYLKDNRKNSIIYEMALNGMETYKLPLEIVIKHILIYQNNLIQTQKEILQTLNVKN